MMIIVGHYLLNLVNLLLLLLLIIRMDKFPTSIVSPKAHKNYPQLSCQETWVRVWVWGRYFLKKGTWVRRGYCYIYIYIYTGTWMLLFEKGYSGTSGVLYIYICHSHIIHVYRFLHKLWIIIHNYKFAGYLNSEHSDWKFET